MGRFVRWIVTWPVLVILALNIENLADFTGTSGLLQQNWAWLVSVLNWASDTATTSWVFNFALIALGAILYEWTTWVFKKVEHRNSRLQIWLMKVNCGTLSRAFAHKGFTRRYFPVGQVIDDINFQFSEIGLPQVPEVIGDDEEVSQMYSRYLFFVSQGEFEFAKDFLSFAKFRIKNADQEPLSLSSFAVETPR